MTFLIPFASLAILQGNAPLSLDDAVSIAVQNAFSIRQQKTIIEKNRQKIRENEGQLGPRVSISGTYTRYDQESTTSFGSTTIVTQPIDSKNVAASLQLPIDISGNVGRIVQASKASLVASEETLNATRNDVKLNVRRSYLNILRAEDQVAVAKLAVQEAEERLKNAKLELEQGTKAKIDVIRIEAQVAQAQSDLLTVQNQANLSKQVLNNALGRPIETEFQTVHVDNLPAMPMVDQSTIDVAAQKVRPEAKALEKTQLALAYVRRATERGQNPSLNLAINYLRNIDAKGFSARDESTTGTLTLNFPIFDSGVTRAQVKQARQDEESAKIQLDQVRLGISLEVRQAMTNMSNSMARLDVAKRQLASAEENYRIAKVRLTEGAGITIEITDALTQLTQARNSLVSARYDYWTAFSELQRAVGSDELQQVIGGKN